jgi:hypothetical protein
VRRKRHIIVTALWGALAASAWGQSGPELIASGNAKFAAKDYDAAIALYQKAQEGKNAPTAEALHNEGCTLLEQGKLPEAAERFRAAATAASDPEVASRSRFNLGQTLFRQAESAPKDKPEQALDLLRQSTAAFRSVLEVNPADSEAARNVEIARRLMKQAEDQQREEQKKKDQQKQQAGGQGQDQQKDQSGDQGQPSPEQQAAQEQADRLKDLAKRQHEAANASKQASQKGADPQKTDALQKQQQGISRDTAKAEEEQKKQEAGAPSEQLKRAQEEQQKAQDALGKQSPAEAQEHQDRAAKLLEDAAEKAQDKADKAGRDQKAKQAKEQAQKEQAQKDAQKQGQQGDSKQTADGTPKQDQNYDKTAAMLLDRERQRRQERQPVVRAARGSGPPVEKDW